MNNIFPTGGMNLGFSGNLPQYGGSDPLDEIVNLYEDMVERRNSTANLSRIAQQAAQPIEQNNIPSGPSRVIFKDDEMTDFQKGSLGLRERELQSRDAARQASSEARKKQLSISEYRAQNPNKRFIVQRGGNIIAFDPATGESEDTGIDSGTLSDADRARIQNDYRVSNREDTQRHQQGMEETRQKGRKELQEDRQAHDDAEWGNPIQTYKPNGDLGPVVQVNSKGETRQVKGVEGGIRAPQRPIQPSQERHAIDNKIREAIARNPEWAKYINPETGTVAPVGAGASMWGSDTGLTAEERNKILDYIYGPSGSTPNNARPQGETETAPTTTKSQLPPPEQRVIGREYIMGNGQPGIWNGRAFRPKQ